MPTYIVPETVEHALELLECGLLYHNNSFHVPRTELWELCVDEELGKSSVRAAHVVAPHRLRVCTGGLNGIRQSD